MTPQMGRYGTGAWRVPSSKVSPVHFLKQSDVALSIRSPHVRRDGKAARQLSTPARAATLTQENSDASYGVAQGEQG
jgi:hypothetical protein